MTSYSDERVVLLNDNRRPVGSMPKRDVHSSRTPFHLALSCYLFDERGRFLITQRALAKKAWPGVITNSACGHPLLNESLQDAARRVVGHELGCDLDQFMTVLPDFAYRAVSKHGIVEWEYCPVVTAVIGHTDVELNQEEVEGFLWIEWHSITDLIDSGAVELSPWSRLQIAALNAAGPPSAWRDRSAELPEFLQ